MSATKPTPVLSLPHGPTLSAKRAQHASTRTLRKAPTNTPSAVRAPLSGPKSAAAQARRLRAASVSSVPLKSESKYSNASDDEIIEIVRKAQEAWAKRFAREHEIDYKTLKALLPEVITFKELYKLRAEKLTPFLEKLSVGGARAMINILPVEILRELPEKLLKKAFPEDEITKLKSKDADLGNRYGGGYDPEIHKITTNTNAIRQGMSSPIETGAHEGNHGISGLARTALTESEIISAITEGLKNEITDGATTILHAGGEFTELLYIPSSEMRHEVAEFLGSIIDNFGRRDPRVKVYSFKEGRFLTKVHLLSQNGEERLLNIARKYKDFLNLFNNEEAAKLALGNLVDTQLARLNVATGKNEITSRFNIKIDDMAFNQLPKKARDELRKELQRSKKFRGFTTAAAKNYLQLIESNLNLEFKRQVQADTPSDWTNCLFCHEERECDLAEVSTELDSKDLPRERQETLEARKEIFELSKEYMDYKRRINVAAQDSHLVKQENKLRVARIKYQNHLLRLVKISQGKIAPLSGQISGLEELLQRESQITMSIQVTQLKMDHKKLRTSMHEQCHEELNALRKIRVQICRLLAKHGHESKELERFVELLKKEKALHNKVKALEAKLDEACLDPKKRVTDTTLLEKMETIEVQIRRRLKKAKMSTLRGAFPKVKSTKPDGFSNPTDIKAIAASRRHRLPVAKKV